MFNKWPVNPVHESIVLSQDNIGIQSGHEAIVQQIAKCVESSVKDTIIIAMDGTHGAAFQPIVQQAVELLENKELSVNVISSYSFLKTGEELRVHFKDNITSNRAFGYELQGATIEEYFSSGAKAAYRESVQAAQAEEDSAAKRVIVVFGPGARWLSSGNVELSLFLDVSREYQQVLHRGQLLNFGMSWNRDSVEKYKIALFVEWPILETYRKQTLPQFDYYVDMNDEQTPHLARVDELEKMIEAISANPLRVKPFFAPGVWGGQYLKKLADLPDEWENCAWSFEPIAPENSILIGCQEKVIEVPFLIVMSYAYRTILGDRLVRLFGDYFPIRFDYLDTMDGGKLSCQVHPKQAYLREHFNGFMEQQESYYIMEKQAESKVYLGLTESCTKENFYNAIQTAQETGVPMELTDYVNEFEAEKGDLFLIPTGTVHLSGEDNMVLEISATTWWFTFKIYDHLRKGMDGKPRPINVDHGFDNIDFYKNTDWVKANLIPAPVLLQAQGDNEEYRLGQREDLLFYVHRVHLVDEWKDDTTGELVLFNLVEGERVRIVSVQDPSVFVEFGYAESYILPASFGEYKIVNIGNGPCKLIKAGVSPEWKVSFIDG
ncbi:class I mannose-6-phosphate isomerase [Paenibacillus apiarius]|uniref:class I mannose-6-phosphate isomerase n=1 Tax=Paenibacillus apiarius TaxID=46240 RepID=UPI003B3AB793